MKTRFKRIAGVLFTAVLLGICLKVLTDVLERKDSDIKYRAFFEEENDFDVLYFGSSHVLDAFYPMELWEEFGITSYNFGGHGNYIPTTYWVMENAFDYSAPKVVLIDCFFMTPNYKTYYSNASYVHFSLDAFPLSLTKIRTALDLSDDPPLFRDAKEGKIEIANEAEKRDPLAFLWNFIVYHSRWVEVKEEDFHVVPWRTKGSETNVNVADPDPEHFVPLSEKLEEETVAKEYLRKMIEDCQRRGIEVVLTYLPHLANEDDWRAANSVFDIAAEYGVEYLDFLCMDVVDYQTDMSDHYAHLNASGAKKITKFLGEYLRDHFDLESRKEDPAYAGWLEDEQDYLSYKAEIFQGCEDLRKYLMLLNDSDFDAILDVRDIRFWEDERYMALLKNLGVDEKQITGEPRLLAVRGGGEAAVVNREDIEGGRAVQTVLGALRLSDEDGMYQIYLNDEAVISRKSEEAQKHQVDACVMRSGNQTAPVDRVLFDIRMSKSNGTAMTATKSAVRPEAG